MSDKEKALCQSEDLNGYCSFVVKMRDEEHQKQKPILTSMKTRTSKKKSTSAEQINFKLTNAEERRKKNYKEKSSRVAENREKLLNLAVKLDKLKLHHKTLKDGSNCEDLILSKREYVKLASEVSMNFEAISVKTAEDLQKAK